MIKSTMVKGVNNPPFVYGIKGNLFMTMIFIISGVVALSLLGVVFSLLFKAYVLSVVIALMMILLPVLIYIYFKSISTVKLFQEMKSTPSIISHQNYLDIDQEL